jgi:WD40 repeat-containing protein SMU1
LYARRAARLAWRSPASIAVQGLVSPGSDYDLFRGAPKEQIVERADKVVRKSAGKIKFSKSSAPQCAQFSRDGRMLVTGSKDGFVEVWDFDKCKLRKDLEYQAKVHSRSLYP